jgi:hypothetical protein
MDRAFIFPLDFLLSCLSSLRHAFDQTDPSSFICNDHRIVDRSLCPPSPDCPETADHEFHRLRPL